MINQSDRRGKYGKMSGCYLKKLCQIELIFHTYRYTGDVSAGYEVSMIKPVARKTIHTTKIMTIPTHDGQFMIK